MGVAYDEIDSAFREAFDTIGQIVRSNMHRSDINLRLNATQQAGEQVASQCVLLVAHLG